MTSRKLRRDNLVERNLKSDEDSDKAGNEKVLSSRNILYEQRE